MAVENMALKTEEDLGRGATRRVSTLTVQIIFFNEPDDILTYLDNGLCRTPDAPVSAPYVNVTHSVSGLPVRTVQLLCKSRYLTAPQIHYCAVPPLVYELIRIRLHSSYATRYQYSIKIVLVTKRARSGAQALAFLGFLRSAHVTLAVKPSTCVQFFVVERAGSRA